jgi:hypothetical protein
MKIFCVAAALISGIVLAGEAFAFDFSADVAMTSSDGNMSGKIYVSNDKIRMEASDAITITRTDKGVSWIIVPSQNMFIEQPMDPKSAMAASDRVKGETDRINAGDEMVGGRPATKYRVYYDSGQGREQVNQWIDMEYKIPLKTAAVDGSWSVEFRNLSVGPQKADLFEVPERYKKMQVPNMADMMRSAQAGSQGPAYSGQDDVNYDY